MPYPTKKLGKVELVRYFDGNKKVILTVNDYEIFRKEKDLKGIANLIYQRLYGRYLKPFLFPNNEYVEKYKNGFSMMANCCLLIETLVSFKNGWGDSNQKSEEAFKQFLKNNKNFGNLENRGSEIYKNVRCGILHQGETTGGWRIRRERALFDSRTKTINAFKFSQQLKKSLQEYTDELKSSEWDSEVWDSCRTKMRKIIKNCEF
jgi:hypothetical protein